MLRKPMRQVDLRDAKSNSSELLDTALKGEEVVITEDDQPVLRLVPVVGRNGKSRRKAGSAKGQIWFAPDFDNPLDDFSEYMPAH
jgi:antitoxin (DNA-binding transcriptional repressor) of toxin-antitoxin stability system